MSLDSKQKRGSSINLSLPFRPWTSEPSGHLDTPTNRLSLLHFSAATSALDAFVGHFLDGLLSIFPTIKAAFLVSPTVAGDIAITNRIEGQKRINR